MTIIFQNNIANSNPYNQTSADASRAYRSLTSQKPATIPSDTIEITQEQTTATGTRAVMDKFEPLENNGYRRTRVFEQENGRRFSKIEETMFFQSSIRKTVIQQNPSGSITQYEEILDRKSNGAFQRTQRFLDATGESSTLISPDFVSNDAFVLSNGRIGFSNESNSFLNVKGTQLDLTV